MNSLEALAQHIAVPPPVLSLVTQEARQKFIQTLEQWKVLSVPPPVLILVSQEACQKLIQTLVNRAIRYH